MKTKELRLLSEADLEKKVLEVSFEYMKDRSQVAVGTVPKNPGKIKQMRRMMATIKTILHERENKK